MCVQAPLMRKQGSVEQLWKEVLIVFWANQVSPFKHNHYVLYLLREIFFSDVFLMNNIFGLSPSEHFNIKVFLFYLFSWRMLIRKRVKGLIRNIFHFFTVSTFNHCYCCAKRVYWNLESKFVFWPTTICFARKISCGNSEVEPYFKIECFCFAAF